MTDILVIDDEEDVREALERRLQREGYRVSTAGSQQEGTAAIAKAGEPFDIVVTDMLMETAESGVEIIKAAAERDVFTQVIVLTAYGNVANAVECMRRGAFDYVEKNIPGVDVYELLVMKIRQALEHSEEAQAVFRRIQRATEEIPGAEVAAKFLSGFFRRGGNGSRGSGPASGSSR
jgi:DNA-binding NtrC family response regulator